MKRLAIAISLLSVMIAACVGNMWLLSHHIDTMVETVSIAEQALQQGDTARSIDLLQDAHQQFNDAEFLLSITINEKQLDEVSFNFSRALQGGGSDDTSQYAMELAGLKESIIDLKRSEMPTLGNLL